MDAKTNDSPIPCWPVSERPREKLVAAGPGALTDAELLAVLLRSGAPGQSALAVARELIRRFGGLRGLLTADIESVCAVPGLGLGKYAQLQAGLELARRHYAEPLHRDGPLSSPDACSAS